jgi:hypothetical protein
MNETFEKIKAWVMGNPMLAAAAGMGLVFLVKPNIFGTRRRRRRRVTPAVRNRSHKRTNRRRYTLRSKSKPAWMVKGSPAARRRMAMLRRKRAA